MPDVYVSPRAELEARTDEALAWLRDSANRMDGPAGDFYRHVAGEVAAELLAEFPFTFPLGRVVMAVAQVLASAQDGIEGQTGEPVPAEILQSIAFLAASSSTGKGPAVSYAILGFGESVRRLRAEQGLTLRALAVKGGTTISAVAKIEYGRSGGRLDTALAIASALGTTVDTMIGRPPAAVETDGGPRFGPAVRRRRETLGWSRRDLADRSGVPLTTVARVELEYGIPTLMVASLLASPLEASITGLAGKGAGRG